MALNFDDFEGADVPSLYDVDDYDPNEPVWEEGEISFGELADQGFTLPTGDYEHVDLTMGEKLSSFFRADTPTGRMAVRSNYDFDIISTPEEEEAYRNGDFNPDLRVPENHPLRGEAYSDIYGAIRNDRELDEWLRYTEANEQDYMKLQEVSTLGTLGYGIMTLPLDVTTYPLLAMPVARGANFFTRYGKNAGLVGADMVGREYLMRQYSEDRTWEQSIGTVTVGTLIGGAFGGFLGGRVVDDSVVTRGGIGVRDTVFLGEDNLNDALNQNVSKEIREKYGEDVLTYDSGYTVKIIDDPQGGSITPQNFDEVVVVNEDALTLARQNATKADGTLDEQAFNKAKVELQQEVYRVKDEVLIKAAGLKLTKQQRLMISQSPAARAFAYHGLEVPYVMRHIDPATDVNPAVLTQATRLGGEAMGNVKLAYKKYIKDYMKNKGKGFGSRLVASQIGDPEFNKALNRALHTGDTSPDEFVEGLAKVIREETNKLNKELIKAGLLKGDAKTGLVSAEDMVDESWFHRVYDRLRVSNDQAGFAAKLKEGFLRQADDDMETLVRYNEELQAQKARNIERERTKFREDLEDKMFAREAELEEFRRGRTEYINKTARGKQIAQRLAQMERDIKAKRKQFKSQVYKGHKAAERQMIEEFTAKEDARIMKELEKKSEPMHLDVLDKAKTAKGMAELDKEAYLVAEKIGNNAYDNTMEMDLMNEEIVKELLGENAKPNFLRGRNLRVKFEYLEDYLENDVMTMFDFIARRSSGTAALKQKFGSYDKKMYRRKIEDDYDKLSYGLTERQAQVLNNERQDVLKQFDHAWDALSGKNPATGNRNRQIHEMVGVAKGFAIMAKLGTSGITAIEDMAAPFLHLGAKMTTQGIMDIMSFSKEAGFTKAVMRDIQSGWEHSLATGALARAGVDVMPAMSQMSQYTNVATNGFLRATGMPWVDSITKRFVHFAMISRMTRAAKAQGKLQKMDYQTMRKFGMSEQQVNDVVANMRKHGSDTDKWDGDGDFHLKMATDRAGRQIISTPNIGNQPMMMSDPIFSAALQFKSHMIGTTDNHLIPMVQGLKGGDPVQVMNTFFFLAAGMSLTSMNYNIRMYLLDREPDNSPEQLGREFLTRTGGAGPWGAILALGDEQFKIAERLGLAEEGPSMFMTRNPWGHVFGPIPGMAVDTITGTGGIFQYMDDGYMNKNQVRAWRRILPLNNYVGIRRPITHLENQVIEGLGE